MRSLFAKILLWFWLALAVMIATLVLLEANARRRGFALPRRGGDPGALMADHAALVLERDGLAGLDSLLAGYDRRVRMRGYVVDTTGRELTGSDAPQDVRRIAADVLAGREGRLMERDGRLLAAYPMRAGDGTPLVLVLSPPYGPDQRPGLIPFPLPFVPRDLGARGLVLVLVGGLGCYLLALYITAPIKRLRAATRRLTEGDLRARVGSHARARRDELEDLGRDFDRMAERLESLVIAQRRLLSDVSHELRSPLARMNVAIGLLRQRGVDDRDGMLTRLETEAERLNALIGDVLTLSRLESGQRALNPRSFEFAELVEGVAEDARFEANAHGVDVRVTAAGNAWVSGEPELLRSAIENVVRNAVRHAPEGTPVEIALECAVAPGGDRVVLEVRDHGTGVPPGHLQRIFEPFHRVEDARERRSGGAGLGLAIARRAVIQHGGTVEAHPADGTGLRVRIELPCVPASDAPGESGAGG